MGGLADYEQYDALGLAELVRRKEVSPEDLLDAAIERVEAATPAVDAVVMPLYDYGRRRSRTVCRTVRSAACRFS